MLARMTDVEQAEAFRRRRAAAQKWQPKRVHLLLVAPAPPDDPTQYFYYESANSHDPLFDSVGYVLFEEEPSGPKEPYLKLLRRRGVFVIELDPRAPVGEGTQSDPEQWLAMRIDPLQPEHIVTLGREVHAAAAKELERAGLPLVPVVVPFSPRGDRAEFARELRHALVKAGLEKLIKPLAPATKPARPARAKRDD